MVRLPFEGYRGTAVISHIQNNTRLYPDRVIMDVFERKATTLHTTAQSAYVPLYCVSSDMSDMFQLEAVRPFPTPMRNFTK